MWRSVLSACVAGLAVTPFAYALPGGLSASLLAYPTPTSFPSTTFTASFRHAMIPSSPSIPVSLLSALSAGGHSVDELLLFVTFPSSSSQPFLSPPSLSPDLLALLDGLPSAHMHAVPSFFLAYTTTSALSSPSSSFTTATALTTSIGDQVSALINSLTALPPSASSSLLPNCSEAHGNAFFPSSPSAPLASLLRPWLGFHPATPSNSLLIPCDGQCTRVHFRHGHLSSVVLPIHSHHAARSDPSEECGTPTWATLFPCMRAQSGELSRLKELGVVVEEKRSVYVTLSSSRLEVVETMVSKADVRQMHFSTSSTASAASSSSASSAAVSSTASDAEASGSVHAAPVVELSRSLSGSGFHLTLSHSVRLLAESAATCTAAAYHFLYFLPSGMYVDLDELRELRSKARTRLRVLAYQDIDVEQPAHLSRQHAIVLVQPADAQGLDAQVPIHLRYQRARAGGGHVIVELGSPYGVWLECQGESAELVKVELRYAEGGTGWKLVAAMPVGDLDDSTLVMWSAPVLSVMGAVWLAAMMLRKPAADAAGKKRD